jgi:ribosomal protein S18 acetylase RimI-like enzyme
VTARRLVAGHVAQPQLVGSVRHLLATVDREFVPPLSSRSDTVSMESPASKPGLDAYLEAMREELWLLAQRGGAVVGLLSFRHALANRPLAAYAPSLYATTLAVAPAARRTGVARTLYDALERQALERRVPYVTTRTWSTNTSHLRLLDERGFVVVDRTPDDRGGGIGTLYLACAVPRNARAV